MAHSTSDAIKNHRNTEWMSEDTILKPKDTQDRKSLPVGCVDTDDHQAPDEASGSTAPVTEKSKSDRFDRPKKRACLTNAQANDWRKRTRKTRHPEIPVSRNSAPITTRSQSLARRSAMPTTLSSGSIIPKSPTMPILCPPPTASPIANPTSMDLGNRHHQGNLGALPLQPPSSSLVESNHTFSLLDSEIDPILELLRQQVIPQNEHPSPEDSPLDSSLSTPTPRLQPASTGVDQLSFFGDSSGTPFIPESHFNYSFQGSPTHRPFPSTIDSVWTRIPAAGFVFGGLEAMSLQRYQPDRDIMPPVDYDSILRELEVIIAHEGPQPIGPNTFSTTQLDEAPDTITIVNVEDNGEPGTEMAAEDVQTE